MASCALQQARSLRKSLQKGPSLRTWDWVSPWRFSISWAWCATSAPLESSCDVLQAPRPTRQRDAESQHVRGVCQLQRK
eukprot:s494_g12.t1